MIYDDWLLRLFCSISAACRSTRRVAITFQLGTFHVTGDKMQIENLVVGQTVQVTGLVTVDLNSKPTNGVVKSDSFTTSDPTIFTIAPDPTNPLGQILTAVAPGSATLGTLASGTESDGTTPFTNVPGSATIVVAGKPNPTVGVLINFGTPTDAPPAPPNPPGVVQPVKA